MNADSSRAGRTERGVCPGASPHSGPSKDSYLWDYSDSRTESKMMQTRQRRHRLRGTHVQQGTATVALEGMVAERSFQTDETRREEPRPPDGMNTKGPRVRLMIVRFLESTIMKTRHMSCTGASMGRQARGQSKPEGEAGHL